MTKEIQDFSIIGEGKEFYVYRAKNEVGLVYKKPKESKSWANSKLSIVDYHEKIYQILNLTGFSKLLPKKFEKVEVKGLGEVIAVSDLSEAGKSAVIALEELDDVDNHKIHSILKSRKVVPEQVAKKRQEIRELLLGKGTEGLMDELGRKNIVMGADSFHIMISENGLVDVSLDDYGTVLVRKDLDYQVINQQNYNCVMTLLSKLGTLSWIIENKL